VGAIVEERRGWSEPRVIMSIVGALFSGCSLLVAIAGLAVVVFGGLLTAYVVSQTKTATSEVSNQTIVNEMQKMNAKLDGVANDVKVLTNADTAKAGQLIAQDKINTEQQQSIGVLTLQIDGLEKSLAELNGRLSK
jgi:hypothetical protein